MRRPFKVKNLRSGAPLRSAALTIPDSPRRSFPAWIMADEGGVAFPARAVATRVRSALVLRPVAGRRLTRGTGAKGDVHVDRAR